MVSDLNFVGHKTNVVQISRPGCRVDFATICWWHTAIRIDSELYKVHIVYAVDDCFADCVSKLLLVLLRAWAFVTDRVVEGLVHLTAWWQVNCAVHALCIAESSYQKNNILAQSISLRRIRTTTIFLVHIMQAGPWIIARESHRVLNWNASAFLPYLYLLEAAILPRVIHWAFFGEGQADIVNGLFVVISFGRGLCVGVLGVGGADVAACVAHTLLYVLLLPEIYPFLHLKLLDRVSFSTRLKITRPLGQYIALVFLLLCLRNLCRA